MTNPTPLSPAAQAVLDAFLCSPGEEPMPGWDYGRDLAAAFRAAAFQLSFGHATGDGILCEDDLLAIAAELEGASG